ncbi:MAG: single-stranded-DNA-specific exonuclease RecJ [Chloroflexi bacterium]|nr:single-stranded-DNA-specific exonuclease RecJ [Chloroflexota bacterium]MBP8058207.1 single-stranded-DNA-specific exonuclease RecJ [Chloroflexota bacterium]
MTIRPASLPFKRWQVAPTIPPTLRQHLSNIPPVLAQILFNRGLTDKAHIQAFLEGRYLESDDPFRLKDMDKAVARIEQAIQREESIVVYGDFDADGVTSTVLLVEALRGLGLSRTQVQPYIPDRVDEGYGLNKEALTTLKQKGVGLVISVDCGIRSVAEVVHANQMGLDMIVTDHHSLGTELPPAVAVINPKRPDSEYAETMLAGVGIAFKLAQALRLAMPNRAMYADHDLLDLVAIGTVADLAPLLGENRRLVIQGLEVLNHSKRMGVQALVHICGYQMGQLSAESIGFGLGPRINAAGRLAHAYTAAKLLSTGDPKQAGQLADELNELNRQRQTLTARLSERAEHLVEPGAPLLFAAATDFVSGVVGLVASRLAEQYYRPAIIVEQGEEESRGSCRSIPELHITELLDECADLLVRYGGHAQAAGLTVRNENMPALQERLITRTQQKLDGLELIPSLSIDMELDLDEVDYALYGHLQGLEPTGYANATPIFLSRNVMVQSHRAVGTDQAHLQMALGTSGRNVIGCIAFRQGAWAGRLPECIDVVYTIGVNEFRGQRKLQLQVQDIRPAQARENLTEKR